jgi:ribose 5-phosphate isomerase RpiB
MRVGVAADHGGFGLKEELVGYLRAAGNGVVDFGAHSLDPLKELRRKFGFEPERVVAAAKEVLRRS